MLLYIIPLLPVWTSHLEHLDALQCWAAGICLDTIPLLESHQYFQQLDLNVGYWMVRVIWWFCYFVLMLLQLSQEIFPPNYISDLCDAHYTTLLHLDACIVCRSWLCHRMVLFIEISCYYNNDCFGYLFVQEFII